MGKHLRNYTVNLLPLVIVLVGMTGCLIENTTQVKQNQLPEIISLSVFPEYLASTDSAIVICEALDPDGDTLVYDWFTDSRLRIKGTTETDFDLYHTSEKSRIFYPRNLRNVFPDTLHVTCTVRDVKGGSSSKMVLFYLIAE